MKVIRNLCHRKVLSVMGFSFKIDIWGLNTDRMWQVSDRFTSSRLKALYSTHGATSGLCFAYKEGTLSVVSNMQCLTITKLWLRAEEILSKWTMWFVIMFQRNLVLLLVLPQQFVFKCKSEPSLMLTKWRWEK